MATAPMTPATSRAVATLHARPELREVFLVGAVLADWAVSGA